MKIKRLLQLQEIIEDKHAPVDIYETDMKYYSNSKDKECDILDMDLIHVIRALAKQKHVTYKSYEIEGQLSRIKNLIDNVRILVNSVEQEINGK
jgi:hypothetical protein